jgi:hypothetical protein
MFEVLTLSGLGQYLTTGTRQIVEFLAVLQSSN